jgi:hypothetical protein
MVTAPISEALYHQLQFGRPARFLPRGSREETVVGRIIRLSRASSPNLAIQNSSAAGETYHVTVAMPKPAEGGSCSVGRAGVLKFDDDASEKAATANVRNPGRGRLSIKRMS